jgi:hypothetical protein
VDNATSKPGRMRFAKWPYPPAAREIARHQFAAPRYSPN